MKICEGCIKQDVCKFKNKVKKYENGKCVEVEEPLTANLICKYKKFEPDTPTWTIYNDTATTRLSITICH